MKRMLRKMKQTASVVLAVAMTMTSLPQTGAYARAEETESLTEAEIVEESIASHDGTDDETTVPGNSYLSAIDPDNDYKVDTSMGYVMTDANMSPSSYSAQFTAKLNKHPSITDYLMVIYIKEEDLADDFFLNETEITKDTLNSADYAGYQAGSLADCEMRLQQDPNNPRAVDVKGDFPRNSGLEPNTTYWYRAVFSFGSKYYFLTVPQKFTTGAPIETSSVKVTSQEVEIVGYNRAKVVWTVDNPNNEHIISQNIQSTGSCQTSTLEKYPDEKGNPIPGKYYAIIIISDKTEVKPELTVYTGEGKPTTISREESLVIEPKDIKDAEITMELTPSYTSYRVQIQISPWYDVTETNSFVYGDLFYWRIYYRAEGETSWQGPFRENISSGNQMITRQDALSPETTYEYYMELSTNAAFTDCICNYGTESEPLTFTTKEMVTYEDSDFPDEVLRKYIKERLNIPENDKITGDKLEKLTDIRISPLTSPDADVESLEGIQYIENLSSLQITRMSITNADNISSLTGLTIVNLNNNDLTSLPDMSAMKSLRIADFEENKIASGITEDKLPAAFLEANPSWLSDTARLQRIPAATPSQAEISAMYASLPWRIDVTDTYAVNPSTKNPFTAGRLSDTSMSNALNLLNFARYTAGIPYDVTLSDTYIEQAQAGTLVLGVNNTGLSHYPQKPSASGFPDDLYEMGYRGCGRSNLAAGYWNMADSILGWLEDGDSSNIGSVGHRRWVLNPSMSATGFGSVNAYSAMYAMDTARGTAISDFVAWPARNMPIEFIPSIFYPWSVSLGSDYYIENKSQVTVTMKNSETGKTWNFDSTMSDYDENYLSINIGGYGQGGVIIFRPKINDVEYEAGSKFEVSISGLKDKKGKDKALSYTVEFFSLNGDSDQTASISLNKTTLRMTPGDSETLTATVKGGNPDDTTVTWSTSNATVATVDETGKVTAIAVGDAVITAFYQGKTATCEVSVRDYSISHTELAFDLADGARTETLTVSDGVTAVKDVTWSSSDESVASVTKNGGNGIVTPKGSGIAQIQAEIKDGPVLVCIVTVTNNVLKSISLNIQECTLEKGASRHLKLYFVPNDTTLSKEATWTSSNPEVASVDTAGMVTAVSRGTAVITATVGALEAKCTVTVYETAAPDEKNIPSGLCALTNVQTKLSDVSLKDYKGWEWENGDIPLAQFAGTQEKSFAAVYSEEGYADYRTTLNVSLATVTGITIVADQTTLKQNTETNAKVQWKISGSDDIMTAYANSIQWSSSNPSLVEVKGTGGAASPGSEAVLKTGASTGKANITAQITLGAKTYKAICKVTVVDSTTAVFENIVAEGFTIISTADSDPVCYEGMLETQIGSLKVTVTNASSLTVKSSNAKVVSVGKAKPENGTYDIPLTLKAAGMAKITLTTNDAAKTGKEILLYVKDPKPNLSEDTIQVNKLQTAGTLLYIYPNDGYTVNGYELTGADASRFEALSPGVESDSYVIKPGKDTPKGSYKLTIKVTVAETASGAGGTADAYMYELPLTVKVTEQAPKYKVKQSAKANLFYKNLGAPQLTVTTEETLTGMTLTGCDYKLTENSTEEGISYSIAPNTEGTLTTSSNKKGTLQLTFEGYETISIPYTVGVETKKPKLSLENKTLVFYPNADILSAKINIKSGSQPLAPESVTTVLRKASGFELTKTEDGLTLSGGNLSAAATIKEEIEISCDNWASSITLPFTIKVNMGKPSVKLKKTTLQLNANTSILAYEMVETEVMWKDAAYFAPDTRLNVSAADEKSQAIINDGIVFEQDGNKIIARLNNKSVVPGSYKFKVNVTDIPGTPASLTVKVVNADLSKAVKISSKGSIDVLNRAGSCVTVTPTLKSLNGDITDIKLTGRFAHLFRAELGEKNRILIYAKDTDANGRDVALITKYPYSVNLVLTLTNAKGETTQLTTAEIRLKLKQGKPKLTVTPKNAAFFSGAYNSVKLDLTATLKGASNPEIVNVELINFTDVFIYSYSEGDGILTLPRTGTAAKGKSYNLQFKITYRNQADNEKATIVKYNVKVK